MTFSRSKSLMFWLCWHSVALIGLLLVPTQLRLGPMWEQYVTYRTFFLTSAASYIMVVGIVTVHTRRNLTIRLRELSFIFVTVFGGFFFVLLLSNAAYKRGVLVVYCVMAFVCILLPMILRSKLQSIGLFVFSAVVMLVFGMGLKSQKRSDLSKKVVRSTLYDLDVKDYSKSFGIQDVPGGGITQFGKDYLVVAGDGQLYLVSRNSGDDTLSVKKIPQRVPLNRPEFIESVRDNKDINPGHFRTAGIILQDLKDGQFRLFASHHYWYSANKCFAMRVSSLVGSFSSFVTTETPQQWQTVYETEPCLGFRKQGYPFVGFDSGGRLALLDRDYLLLTVGDHGFNGVYTEQIFPQNKTASYGKTILINLGTHQGTVYSLGHRNPQGLYISPSGNIWLTEHGPKGGDELNLIRKDTNYGWPLVTYGTDYNQYSWPLNSNQGRHQGFEEPVFAWLPSIGISNLISINKKLFGLWRDDLIIASLNDRALWRIHFDKQRVVLTERIEIGERIRDIIEDSDGRIVIWTEKSFEPPTSAGIIIVEPITSSNDVAIATTEVSAKRGELLFARCSGCHDLRDGDSRGIGPTLKGIIGRRIASGQGYTFTKAFRNLSGSWNEENLDQFLADPVVFAPGTSMGIEGIAAPSDRASLIAYLKQIR